MSQEARVQDSRYCYRNNCTYVLHDNLYFMLYLDVNDIPCNISRLYNHIKHTRISQNNIAL